MFLATSAFVRLLSITKDTAGALYSCVNLRRVEPMVLHSFDQERHDLVSTKPGTAQSHLLHLVTIAGVLDQPLPLLRLIAAEKALTTAPAPPAAWHARHPPLADLTGLTARCTR